MKNNTTIRLIIKFILSIIAGLILAMILLTQNNSVNNELIKDIENILYNYTAVVYLVTALLLLLPSTILHFVGKKAYGEMMSKDDDELNSDLLKKSGYMDLSMSFLGVFITVNFMQFGMLYNKTTADSSMILVLFMVGILFTSTLQVATVKYVQKFDKRLKGDPTKSSFDKEFVESMDEAEQLKTYKAGYKSFQMTKIVTQIIVVITIFMNIIFGTGGFAIFISCLFMLVETVSFAYHEKNTI
jgi:lysylphosphatidylglycerol synthetase-like protein (DUF2156 family)